MGEEHGHSGESHESHGGGGHGGHGGGHGGGGHAEGEHEGAPEWLISFADNVALMMGFFVILLAMNMGPKATAVQGGEPSEKENYQPSAAAQANRQLDFVIGVRSAFNNPPDPANPADAQLIKRMMEREATGETRTPGPEGSKKNLSSIRPSDYVNINAMVTFAEGSTALSEQARRTLLQAADSLRGTQWIVEVRGHTSAAETRRDKAKAMKLAYERALAAAGPLVEGGVAWDHLRIVGCADNERALGIAHGKHEHAENQRVEVVVTQESVRDDPYAASLKPAGSGHAAPSQASAEE